MSKHHWYPQKIICAFCLGVRIEFNALKWSSRLDTKHKPTLPLQQQKAALRIGSECTDFRQGACGVHRKMDLVPCVLGL